jgi:tetratricopeptide (TPR) repeat protein
MPPSAQPFALYNPALLSPEALLGEFIARQPLLETLLDTIRQNSPGHAPQHILLVGPRGMGKTTTLWAVAHRVNRDPALAAAWLPVVFDEESRRVGDLADFWLEAIRQWEHATKSPGDRTRPLLDRPGDDIEDRARQTFLDAIAPAGRRILLLIDNLNDVLASIRDPEPLHRLRAFLMDESRVMLIGGATRTFPQITDLDQPFYDFFRVFELRPLSLDEMKACLLTLAQNRGDSAVEKTIRESAGTLRALHLLTGGNPRLIKTFYRLLAEGLRGDIRSDLERLLDEFTPYFKAIVDALPTQQQRIFDAVALHWDPVDVATLAHATRVPSNQVSAQLRMLVKAGHVTEAAGQPKKKTYLLADRFSNIHYLMRHGRAARSRFDWFVAILRLVFPDKAHADAFAKLALQTAECGTDGMRDARDLIHSALNRSDTAEARRELLRATFRAGWDTEAFKSFSDWLDLAEARQHLPESDILAFFQQVPTKLRRKLGYKPEEADWWCRIATHLKNKAQYDLAESGFIKALELNPKLPAAWYMLGSLLHFEKGKLNEAETAYRKAVTLDPSSDNTWFSLGLLLHVWLKRNDEAEAAYKKALEINPQDAFSWKWLGYLLEEGRPQEAEMTYQTAVEIDPLYGDAWERLAVLRFGNNDIDGSRTAILQAMHVQPEEKTTRDVFALMSEESPGNWRIALPRLLRWLETKPTATDVLDFTLDGFLRFARLTTPAEALALLNSVPEAASGPFETLRDAFIAHADHSHLDRLAPERRVVAIELMKKITETPKRSPQAEDGASF